MSFKRVILDIEANNFLENMLDFTQKPLKLKSTARIWCIVIRCIDTKESKMLIPPYILDNIDAYKRTADPEQVMKYSKLDVIPLTRESLKECLKDTEEFVAHSGIKYDLPALKYFDLLDYYIGYPDLNGANKFNNKTTINGKETVVTDTLLWSKLVNPDRFQHGLEYFGKLFGNQKIEFKAFHEFSIEMVNYCHQDAVVNHDVYDLINSEKKSYEGWNTPYLMEAKLADLSLNQELFGFHYDEELSERCKIELDQLLQDRDDIVTPNIPPKPLNKGDQKQFTPPATKFSKSANRMSKHMSNFLEKIGADYNAIDDTYEFEGKTFDLYFEGCVKESIPSNIKDLAHVKGYLISLGWEPTEWSNRDLVKDSKKQFRDEEKFDKSLLKYAIETFEGPFKELRLEVLELPEDITQEEFIDHYKTSYLAKPTKSIYVPTSPPLRVGTDKELCPGLVKLSEEIPFAKDLAEYFTYSHRRNSISGNVDEDTGEVGSGFESYVREDGRISTPVDTLGTNTSRMAHKVVCNVPRPSSIYGENIRALFGSGPDHFQLGFDFSSLEARIQGHYVYRYVGGPELAEDLLKEKPYDVHTLTGQRLGIDRSDAKAINYAIMYGAQAAKIAKMLKISKAEAEKLYQAYWDNTPALKELKVNLEKYWESTNKEYILALDGRRLNSRSQHSLLNLLFQGAGSIAVKYTIMLVSQYLEERGKLGLVDTDTFEESIQKVYQMIVYHDEAQYALPKDMYSCTFFDTEEEAEAYRIESGSHTNYHLSEKNGKYYISEPNLLTEAILDSIDKAIAFLNVKVYLGMEYEVGRCWRDCH